MHREGEILEVNETRQKIAFFLKYCREIAGLTIQEVGQIINKSNETILNWENGSDQPNTEMFLTLCNIYHVESFNAFSEQNLSSELTHAEAELITLWRNTTNGGKDAAIVVLNAFQKPANKNLLI